MSTSPEPTLGGLRSEIDRIDSAMHELLIERGLIIDRLIEIKARQGGGSAFRPAREASMMRTLAERHRGRLPLDTVESIWRIIISTFTYIQASYNVHVDVSRGEAAIRDSARFHFGFTVPCSAATLLRRGSAVRRYLAWELILLEQVTLDLSPLDVEQAEYQNVSVDGVVDSRIPESYQWLLVSVQASPQAAIEWHSFRLAGQPRHLNCLPVPGGR